LGEATWGLCIEAAAAGGVWGLRCAGRNVRWRRGALGLTVPACGLRARLAASLWG